MGKQENSKQHRPQEEMEVESNTTLQVEAAPPLFRTFNQYKNVILNLLIFSLLWHLENVHFQFLFSIANANFGKLLQLEAAHFSLLVHLKLLIVRHGDEKYNYNCFLILKRNYSDNEMHNSFQK